jgi:hypothetical protein
MRVSSNGKSVHLEVGFWLHDDGSIHVTSNELEGFHVAVNSSPTRRNGHPTLFRRLAQCLRDMGAPAPTEPPEEATPAAKPRQTRPAPDHPSYGLQEVFGTAFLVGAKWYFRYQGGRGVLVPLEASPEVLGTLVDGQAYSLQGRMLQDHRPMIGGVAAMAAKPIGT